LPCRVAFVWSRKAINQYVCSKSFLKIEMTVSERIDAFAQLGQTMLHFPADERAAMAMRARAENGWFNPESVAQALDGIAFMLEREKLVKWTSRYQLSPEVPKIVGVIMAGNIPLVGFHDLMSVLMSGHLAAVKMSSQDRVLMQQVIDWLVEIEPRFKRNIDVREKLDVVDAVIATGSDNTARYFDYYFGKYPHIIRKNRTSVAVLDGTETADELAALGADIFTYYGLGCRNVSKVFTPKGFDFTSAFPHWESFAEVANHNKYRNNYDYQKAIYLVNGEPHLDTGFLLIRSTDELVSPTSVLYHSEYSDKKALDTILKNNPDKIQCIVGHGFVPFGQAQCPEPWDYADGVDVMAFLDNLK